MAEMTASVVLCTYNRAHLLKRSLVCYEKQTMKDFELIILDDGSEDETEELVRSYSDRLTIRYQRLEDKKPGEWRDAGAIINRGIVRSVGSCVFITHPEVMICFDCLEKSCEALKDVHRTYFNARVYYCTPPMQEALDTLDWQGDFYAVRSLTRFYDEPEPLYREEYLGMVMNQYCTPHYAETCEYWDSWVFGGMTRTDWKEYGGMNESDHWGTVDFDFMQRRRLINWKTISPTGIFVIHQNHDSATGKFKPTVRNLDSMLVDALEKYPKKRNFLKEMKV